MRVQIQPLSCTSISFTHQPTPALQHGHTRYDALGNLNTVLLPDGRRVDYLVDGRNRRLAKKVNGAFARKFLYNDQLRIAVELSPTNAVVSRFVYATRVNVPDYLVKGSTTYRIVTDHLGSPRLVINVSTGAIAQRMDYDEFGRVTLDTNPGFQPFGFAGGLYDPDTGLVRFGARDYDAEVARWTGKDPTGLGGGDTDLYIYGANDSVNWIDLTGLDWTDWDLQAPADIIMGLGDALTFGGSAWVRERLGLGNYAHKCSGAYFAGEVASFAIGSGRLAYAGTAKALPWLITGGNTMERALQISAARNELKSAFRLGLFAESRMPAAAQIVEKSLVIG